MPDAICHMPDIRCELLEVGYQLSEFRCPMIDVECQISRCLLYFLFQLQNFADMFVLVCFFYVTCTFKGNAKAMVKRINYLELAYLGNIL